jgi:hypothetical protein
MKIYKTAEKIQMDDIHHDTKKSQTGPIYRLA